MRKIEVSELQPGMVLARDVYLEDGKLLLLSGFTIKQRYINKLISLKVPYVYIEEDEVVPIEEISEEKVYNEAFSAIKHVMTSIREGKDLDIHVVRDTISDIIQVVMNNEYVFFQLTGIRDIDSYTFVHSLDVCIFSLITGKNMGLSNEELSELGIGAILHDIGKCKVPLSILMKPYRLTDEEFYIMKLHSLHGHEILSNTPGISKRIANIALQHHEKWDGGGYPLGLKDYEIDKYARIVSIADVYDALTADRVYRKRVLPHVAAEYIMGYSSIIFDPEIVKVFIKNITTYPEGLFVILNTGEIGVIVETNKVLSIRPKVKVIARKEGPPVIEPYVIDLMVNPSVVIVDILDH